MNRHLIALYLSAFLAVASFTSTSHGQEKARKGFLSVEIGPDYLVIEDIAGVTETRIHVTSIKSITRLKLPKE